MLLVTLHILRQFGLLDSDVVIGLALILDRFGTEYAHDLIQSLDARFVVAHGHSRILS